jgi:hypothetical protein
MEKYEIKIEWDGPFKVKEVINRMTNAGEAPLWNGEDYGLYQIYGEHILCGDNTLLYIGITTERTFSQRFKEHKTWLDKDQREEAVKIYLGRVYDPERRMTNQVWTEVVKLAEKIMLYKYAPNYNSRELTGEPDLSPHTNIRLVHIGKRFRLDTADNVPEDFFLI